MGGLGWPGWLRRSQEGGGLPFLFNEGEIAQPIEQVGAGAVLSCPLLGSGEEVTAGQTEGPAQEGQGLRPVAFGEARTAAEGGAALLFSTLGPVQVTSHELCLAQSKPSGSMTVIIICTK